VHEQTTRQVRAPSGTLPKKPRGAGSGSVLVLSAHTGQLDRRIIAQVNTLADSGRHVTLVGLPAFIAAGVLESSVRVVMPRAPLANDLMGAAELSLAHRLGRHLPGPLYRLGRYLWQRRPWPHANRADRLVDLAPPGNFDVIHCHDADTLPAAVTLRRQRMPRAKIIYDSHEFYPFQFADAALEKYWVRIEHQNIGQADIVITVNDSVADAMASLYDIAPPRVIYNSYGVKDQSGDCTLESFLRYFRAPPGGRRVLFQGLFHKGRNLQNLVAGLAMLGSGVQLFMLGAGEEEGRLRRICRKHPSQNVFFGPLVPQDRLLSLTRQAELGIIPYLGDKRLNNRLCTPNKLFEFIEAGVPICASDLPELRRIVRGHGVGDVYAMESPGQIADAVRDCLRRRDAGEFEPNLAPAADRLSWRRQAEVLLSLYDELGV
jgi:glycosyltransferase involved in cell wall biosynthesis